MTKRNIIIAYGLGVLSIIASVLLYMEQQNIGFPDGHLTELDRAEKPIIFVLSFILIVSGLLLLYLGRFAKWKNSNRLFYGTLILVLVAVLITASLDVYFNSILENGGGG